MKYRITLDQIVDARNGEEALEWVKDHFDNFWDVTFRVEKLEEYKNTGE